MGAKCSGFAGMARLDGVRARLVTSRYRSEGQVRLYGELTNACLPILFKEDWERNGRDIARYLGVDFHAVCSYPVFSRVSRRGGMSTAIAVFVAAMAHECNDTCFAVVTHCAYDVVAGAAAGAGVPFVGPDQVHRLANCDVVFVDGYERNTNQVENDAIGTHLDKCRVVRV